MRSATRHGETSFVRRRFLRLLLSLASGAFMAFGAKAISLQGEQRVGGRDRRSSRRGLVGEDPGQGGDDRRANLVREQPRQPDSAREPLPFMGQERVDRRHDRPGRRRQIGQQPEHRGDQDGVGVDSLASTSLKGTGSMGNGIDSNGVALSVGVGVDSAISGSAKGTTEVSDRVVSVNRAGVGEGASVGVPSPLGFALAVGVGSAAAKRDPEIGVFRGRLGAFRFGRFDEIAGHGKLREQDIMPPPGTPS
jgi:hypothetical protein